MLDDFDRQDVLDLNRLVKERFETTSPKGYDRLLWGDLITLFEPSKEDEIWKNQQDYTLISWMLYDSCEIHLLLMDTGMSIHMLAEKEYPLTQEMLSRMLSGRLEVDHECEMAYELIRLGYGYHKNTQCMATMNELSSIGTSSGSGPRSQETMRDAAAQTRRDLKFKDEGGVDFLSNEVIFEQLPLMRFVQVFLDKQVDGMSKHNAIYVIPSHTKMVFSNMKRVGKDFSGRDTPLFPTMIVQAQEELGEDTKILTDTQHTPTEVVADEAVYEEMHNSVETAATTATGLDAEYDRGIISKTQFTATLNEPSSIRTSSGSGPRRQETMGDAVAQTRVLDLEKTKIAQAKEIANLKKIVKRLERKKKSRSHGLKRLYKVRFSARVESSAVEESLGEQESSKLDRIEDIDADYNITLVNDQEMFDADRDLQGVVMQKPSETPTTTKILKSSKVQDKGKDENLAWDNVQAMMDAYYELAARLQEKEQGELTIEEKLRLFMELMDKRKKHFAKLKAEEQRRKPPTKAQKRNQMCVYLKNMTGFTHSQLKNKSFDEVQKAFDKTMSWINAFVPIESEVVKDKAVQTQESSSKRAGDKLDQERSKKQKMEDDKEQEELKRCLEIILDDGDDVTIDATPLSIKTSIIDYKIYKERKKSYF
nr:hypothetical protein [Tanacetum cinerariifolium]